MERKTKKELLNEIFESDYQGILDDTPKPKKLITLIDKVSKYALYLFIPFFIWVFIQIIINS